MVSMSRQFYSKSFIKAVNPLNKINVILFDAITSPNSEGKKRKKANRAEKRAQWMRNIP